MHRPIVQSNYKEFATILTDGQRVVEVDEFEYLGIDPLTGIGLLQKTYERGSLWRRKNFWKLLSNSLNL